MRTPNGAARGRTHLARIGKKWNILFSRELLIASRKLEEDNLKKFLMIGALAFAATSSCRNRDGG